MKGNQTEYYFSTIALFLVTVFFVGSSSGLIYLFLVLYEENLLVAIILSLPLLVFLIGLPDYIRFMYCAVANKPALVLNTESLINNANGKVYRWSQIKSISYEPHTGYRAPPGGYISVELPDSESTFRIPQNLIKGKTKNILQDLRKYHKAHYRQKIERKEDDSTIGKS